MNPNDFGIEQIADLAEKIRIESLVRSTSREIKRMILESRIEAMGLEVELTSSKTGFGGVRLWFKCPSCSRRCGVLYRDTGGYVACRKCGRIKYRKSRYKGMLEEKFSPKSTN
jgi:hypothetical protein